MGENASASLQQSVVIIAISVLELTLGSPIVKPVCVMKKELLTKIVPLRMDNVLVDQTLLDTNVTNVPQVSLDSLTVNLVNVVKMVPEMFLVITTLENVLAKLMSLVINATSVHQDFTHFPFVKDVHATHKDLAIPLVMFHQGDVFVKNVGGDNCDTCATGYYDFPNCKDCGCDVTGAVDKNCDAEGKCMCKEGYTGDKCNQCAAGNFGFPNCHDCECNADGSVNNECNSDGECNCKEHVQGNKCDTVIPGWYKLVDPKECNCNEEGSEGIECNDNGHCKCRCNVIGDKCDTCADN